jgi:hypothetical protein
MKRGNSILAVPLFLLTMLMLPGHIKSQTYVQVNISQAPVLTADAGPDQSIDVGQSLTLGGTPAATGGTGSITFIWDPPYHIDNIYIPNPLATPPGNMTYTLLVYDERGCTATDKAVITVIGGTGIADRTADGNIVVYPNPSNGAFTLEIINGHANDLMISVMTMTGQVIHNEILKGGDSEMKTSIDLSALPKGTYILRISSDLDEIYRNIILN